MKLAPPDVFQPDETLKPPDLSRSPDIHLADWSAFRTADHRAELVGACFELKAESWAEEEDALALAKLDETVSGTAVRAAGFGELSIASTKRLAPGTERTLVGRGPRADPAAGAPNASVGAGVKLDARAVQGFVVDARGHVLVSCFALCADEAEPSRCADAVHRAELPSSFVAPPEPSPALRGVLFLVHHPTETAWGFLALAFCAGAAAVATRKRPKRRR